MNTLIHEPSSQQSYKGKRSEDEEGFENESSERR